MAVDSVLAWVIVDLCSLVILTPLCVSLFARWMVLRGRHGWEFWALLNVHNLVLAEVGQTELTGAESAATSGVRRVRPGHDCADNRGRDCSLADE